MGLWRSCTDFNTVWWSFSKSRSTVALSKMQVLFLNYLLLNIVITILIFNVLFVLFGEKKKDFWSYDFVFRKEYSRSDCPASYFCFCGSVKDPISDPWLIPHSCGGICNKALDNQKCGHRCLLLCHPGFKAFSTYFTNR